MSDLEYTPIPDNDRQPRDTGSVLLALLYVFLVVGTSIAAFVFMAVPSSISLAQATGFMASVSLAGEVIAVGGLTASTLSQDVYHLHAEQPPTIVARLSQARANVTLSTVSSVAIAVGGNKGRQAPSNVIDVISRDTDDSWRIQSFALNTPRYLHAAASILGTVIGAGGLSEGNNVTASIEFVTVASDIVSVSPQSTPLSVPRARLIGCAANNITMFAGGTSAAGETVATIDVYNATSGVWSSAQLPSGPRHTLACAAAGDWIVFAGGFQGANGTAQAPSDAVDAFNVVLRDWQDARLLKARGALAAAAIGTRVYIGGGVLASGRSSDSVEVLYTDNWPLQDPALLKRASISLTQAQGWLTAAATADHVFFLGGLLSDHSFSKRISTIPGVSNCLLRLRTLVFFRASWFDLTAIPSAAFSVIFLAAFLVQFGWQCCKYKHELELNTQTAAIGVLVLCMSVIEVMELFAMAATTPRSIPDKAAGSAAYALLVCAYWWAMAILIYSPHQDLREGFFPPPCSPTVQRRCIEAAAVYWIFPVVITICSLALWTGALLLEIKGSSWPLEIFYILQAAIHGAAVLIYMFFTRRVARKYEIGSDGMWWKDDAYFYGFLSISLVQALLEIIGTAIALLWSGDAWCALGISAALAHLLPVQVTITYFIDWRLQRNHQERMHKPSNTAVNS